MDRLSAAFSALADPTRRAILARLAEGETHVGELGKPFRVSGPAISRHLRVLENAGLIAREVDAQRRVCRLRGEGLAAAHDWVEQYRHFWEASLDRLVELVEQPPSQTPPRKKAARRKRAAPARKPRSRP
jgi:DNA-binding transcriptional ArsR family regulator